MSIIRPCAVGIVAFTLIAHNGFAESQIRQAPASATSIQFATELRSEVDSTLQRSATFREQYRRIAETQSLIVGVRTDASLCETSYRARTTFRRYQSGLIVANVAIAP